MPIYITLFKNTQKGSETIKEAPERAAAGLQAVQKAGGRVIGAYATLGRYDYVYVTEFPDTKAGWPVLVQTAMRGSVTGETMEAIPMEEFLQIVSKT
jgi:uncharacterized protein with GYD domain